LIDRSLFLEDKKSLKCLTEAAAALNWGLICQEYEMLMMVLLAKVVGCDLCQVTED
jgi:hypothetical protein